jgi:hypothetical protein
MASSMVDRMIGAATLNVATYEEVEADDTATSQAAMVVALVAVAQAIGGFGGGGLIMGPIAALMGWLIWAGVTYVIGDKIFDGTATWGELLRTIGFAQAPGVLVVFAILPLGIGLLVRGVVGIWMLIAGIIAIRQALDFSTGKAILTAVLGWIPAAILMAIAGV